MAIKKKIKKVAGMFVRDMKEGLTTIASLPGKFIDAAIEADKRQQKGAKDKETAQIIKDWGSVEAYDRKQKEILEARRVRNSKKKTQSPDYQLEYARRMGGTDSRF